MSLALLAPAATAAEQGTVITRATAVRTAAAQGPGVAAAAAPKAAAREAEDHATALPRPPTVTLAAGYRGGSLTPGFELGATVMQDLSLHGLGSARAGAARALVRAVEADVDRAKLEAASRAALAHVAALEAGELLRLRTEALTQAEAILSATRARVRTGVGLPFEQAMALGDVGAARAAMLDAEGTRVEALAELRFSLGYPPNVPLDVQGDLYASDERVIDDKAAVHLADLHHPALAAATMRAKMAAEEVRLTAATLAAPFGIGASFVREGMGDQVITGIVSIPLPVVSPEGFETSRQRAAESAATALIGRARAEVLRDVYLALHDREHWREVREALRAQALDPMREALRLARVQFDVGTHDVSTVLLARQRLVATEEQLARVAAEVQRADIRLARATGTLLLGGAS